MSFPKPTDADKERFRALLPDDPRLDVKPMFGSLGAFVNGNMFAGLFGSSVGVKLPDDARQEVVAAGGGPFGPAERPMAGYVTLPDDDPAAGSEWVAQAFTHVAELPPKAPKAKAPKGRSSAGGGRRG